MISGSASDRDQRTPTHIAGKAYTLFAMKRGTHQRTDAVASDHDIEHGSRFPPPISTAAPFSAGSTATQGAFRRISAPPSALGKDIEQVGAMNLKPAGAETFGHRAFGLRAEQNLAGDHVAREHETRLEAALYEPHLPARARAKSLSSWA